MESSSNNPVQPYEARKGGMPVYSRSNMLSDRRRSRDASE